MLLCFIVILFLYSKILLFLINLICLRSLKSYTSCFCITELLNGLRKQINLKNAYGNRGLLSDIWLKGSFFSHVYKLFFIKKWKKWVYLINAQIKGTITWIIIWFSYQCEWDVVLDGLICHTLLLFYLNIIKMKILFLKKKLLCILWMEFS